MHGVVCVYLWVTRAYIYIAPSIRNSLPSNPLNTHTPSHPLSTDRPAMPRAQVVQRRASMAPSMMAGGAKVKVGIVGATGAVGEEIVKVS